MTVAVCDLAKADLIAPAFDTVLCCGPKHTIAHAQHFGQYFIDRDDGPFAPRRDQIERLLDYARQHPGRTLCYCNRGESRSTAVAIGVAIVQGVASCDARRSVIQHGRTFTPHRLILGHVASILGVELSDLIA